jgi:ABC-type branched-subunit amino acid transport system ATPase component
MKIESAQFRNFLTFGPESERIYFSEDRTVIVGPNGSGKSSFLRAIEFVGLAFQGRAPWAGVYVHRGDPTARIDLRVSAQLSVGEQWAALLGALLGAMEEPRIGGAQPNQQKATKAVAEILRRSPELFRGLFAEPVTFRVTSTKGYGQSLDCHVSLRAGTDQFELDGANRLTLAPLPDNPWGSVQIAAEVFRELRKLNSTFYDLSPPGPEASPEELESVSKLLTVGWLAGQLAPSEGHQRATQLMQVQLEPESAHHPGFPSHDQSPEVIELTDLRSRKSQAPARTSLFELLGAVYAESVIHLTGGSSQFSQPPDSTSATEPGLSIPAGGLPGELFALKNHWVGSNRARFKRIESLFESVSGRSFDVVQVPFTPPAKEGDLSGSIVEVPAIIFDEEGLSYPAEFAAAGFRNVLETLYATCGHTDSVILLDEPALNLHPAKQRQLYQTLVSDAKSNHNQVFLVTHSSSFAAPEDLAHGVRMTFVDKRTLPRRLNTLEKKEDARMLKDVNRYPRLLDALFSNCALLVEGYDEEAGLPTWFSKCDAGDALGTKNVVVLPVASDNAFGGFVRVLDAWGCPWRIIADRRALPRLSGFDPETALTYPEDDFSDLLMKYYPDQTKRATDEYSGRLKEKDPVVARIVATETDPPQPIRDLWEKIRPFIVSS